MKHIHHQKEYCCTLHTRNITGNADDVLWWKARAATLTQAYRELREKIDHAMSVGDFHGYGTLDSMMAHVGSYGRVFGGAWRRYSRKEAKAIMEREAQGGDLNV